MTRQHAELILYNSNHHWFFQEITQEFLDMTGFSAEEIHAHFPNNILDFFSKKDAMEISALFNNLNPGINFSLNTYSLHNAHISKIDVLLQFSKAPFDTQKIKLMIIDLSSETKKTLVLKERLNSLESSSPGGLCQVLMNDEFTIVWHNQNFLDIIGYTKEQFTKEIHGQSQGYIHPDDLPLLASQFSEIDGKTGQSTSLEFRIIRRDGDIRTLISTFAYTGEFYHEEPYQGIPIFYSSGVDITEIKHSQDLEWATERFRIAMEQTSSCVWEYNIAERKILASQSLQKILGLAGDIQNVPDSIIASKLIHEDSVEDCKKLFVSILQGVERIESTIKLRNISGKYIWAKISMTVLFDELGLPFKAIALMEDITKSYHLKMSYHEEEQRRLAMTFNQMFACKLNISANKVLEVNAQFFPDYREEFVRASTLVQQYTSKFIHPDDRAEYLQGFSAENLIDNFQRENTEITLDYRIINYDNSYSWQQANAHIIQEPSRGELLVYVYTKDIHQQKIDELELRRHAERDSLTNLYNRYTTEIKCQEILKNDVANNLLAMISLDLDGFKNVNDSYGHICGDEVLQNVSTILNELFTPEEAIIGRLGGDEFMIFLINCAEVNEVKQKAQMVCEKISYVFGNPYNISASLGIALKPSDGIDYESLYQAADLALYEAKRLGKNCYIFYEKSMSTDNCPQKQSVSREWLLDESNDIIYVSDLYNYDLLYMNKNTKRLFNIEGDSYKGQKCFKVLQNLDHPCDFCTNHLLSRDSFYIWQYRNPTINQTLFLKDRIVDWYGRAARIELATDITTVEACSLNLAEQLHMDDAIIRCYRNFDEEASFKVALDSSIRIIGELYQADRVFIMRPHPQTNINFIKYIWLRNGVHAPIIYDEEWEKINKDFNSLKKGICYNMNDPSSLIKSNPAFYHIYQRNNVFCQRILPLFFEGVVTGFIGLDNPTKLRDDLTALETLGYCISTEITKQKLIARLETLSSYDPLTGLYNRIQFMTYMENLPIRRLDSLGMIIVDLNALGKINRLHGYKEGDHAIKSVADLLKDIFTQDSVFRIRSERFIAIYENCSEEQLFAKVQLIINDSKQLPNCKITLGHSWSNNKSFFSKLIEQARKMVLPKSIPIPTK